MKSDFHPLVSCVVPIYNAEKYLTQGVESLLDQSYDNIEIILVDDWSSDNSWTLIQEFAKKHSNIVAVQTRERSGGPLRGRERGIQEAKGEWIAFMDGDDFVGSHYVEHLLEATKDGKYDIAVTGYSRFFSDDDIQKFEWEDYSQTTKKRLETFYKHFLNQDYYTDPTDTVGQNLVRASVAKATDLSKYPNKIWAEDTIMALSFLANSKNGINFTDRHDFFWRQISGSGSNGGFSSSADKPAFFKACYDIFNEKDLLPLVSVIVPVYNVEKYLEACVDSILSQTYPNIEVILVDDVSTDTSGKIADKYEKSDSRVQVIHKAKNEGLNMARKTGFDASTGEYITFLDSDDVFHTSNIAHSLRALVINKSDSVVYAAKEFNDDESIDITAEALSYDENTLSDKTAITEYALFGKGNLADIKHMTAWGKLFSRQLLKGVDWKASNYRVYEDNFWTPQVLLGAENVTLLSSQLIYYRHNTAYGTVGNNLGNKLTGNSHNGKPVGYVEYIEQLRAFYEKLVSESAYREVLSEQINSFTLMGLTWRIDNLVKAGLLDTENNTEFTMKHLPDYVEAKNGHIQNLDATITYLQGRVEEEERRAVTAEQEVIRLNQKISDFHGIKRSVKLLAGNIKRRIKNF